MHRECLYVINYYFVIFLGWLKYAPSSEALQ